MPPENDTATPLLDQDQEAIFREGWHAQVLAVANGLINSGHIEATTWTRVFANALREVESQGNGDTLDGYYGAALDALESILDADNALTRDSLNERTETWRLAYLNTPHGQPVELTAGLRQHVAE